VNTDTALKRGKIDTAGQPARAATNTSKKEVP